MTQQNLEIEGVKNLKSGTLFYLISVFLFIIFYMFIFGLVGTVGILIGVILEVIDFVPILLGFLRTRRGFSQLEMAGRKVGGKTATTLIMAGFVTLFVGSIVALALFNSAEGLSSLISGSSASSTAGISQAYGGEAVAIIGAYIMYIGYVRLAQAYRKLGSLYNTGSLRRGATLTIVSSRVFFITLPTIIFPFGVILNVIVGLIVFIGNIMIHSGLGTLLVMLQPGRYPGFYQPYYGQPYQGAPQPYQPYYGQPYQGAPQPYQPYYGQPYQGAPLPPQYPPLQPFNRIYGNGVAEVNVYSPEPVQVTSATIIGTSYSSNQVTPTNLAPGNNVIRISFNGQLNLVPGNVYTIQITLSNGQLITVNAAYQP